MNIDKRGFRSQKPTSKALIICLFRWFCPGEGVFYCIKISRNIDPACGSGNFLTETYLSLRRLENKAISELHQGQIVFDLGNPIQVSISQFYGIEINDFAVTVAKTALWIAESQMMKETEDVVHMSLDFLPLKTNACIIEGNALRPPFMALTGVGEAAAQSIAEERQKEPFMSQEDISLRCGKASTAVVQSLRDIGALGDLPESNQLDLFAAMF